MNPIHSKPVPRPGKDAVSSYVYTASPAFYGQPPHASATRLDRRMVAGLCAQVVASAVLIASCASTPIAPTPDMVRAEAAIGQAQKAGAGELANDSLQAALTKLSEAKTAAASGDGRRSQNLVDESMADAQLADLTAQSITANKASAEVDKSINAIRTEADRRNPQ